MEIYPEDLGPRQCGQVLEQRTWRVGTDGGQAVVPPVSPAGRAEALLKTKQFSVQECIAACFLLPLGIWIVFYTLFHASFWTALTVALIGFLWQKRQRTQVCAPPQGFAEPQTGSYARLTEAEIAFLQNALLKKGNEDPLLEMYLDLVWAAMNTPLLSASRTETERNAREAIRALGGAIETLPPRTADGLPDSQTKLEAAAARLAAQAPGEPDPVVAASLQRRVEALQGQAETAARVKVLLRRHEALRAELADQIGALRTSLAAAALGGNDSGPEMAGLAARIRRVASEANAVTDAHVEVDTLLSQSRAGTPLVQEEVRQQRVGLNGEVL